MKRYLIAVFVVLLLIALALLLGPCVLRKLAGNPIAESDQSVVPATSG